jgi:basic membrane lipoprotein Med (substrate-binding protein (PBP1-ABC) superfamily)
MNPKVTCIALILIVLSIVGDNAVHGYNQTRPLNILFIYPNSISDFGYTYAFELARTAAEQEFTSKGYHIYTTFLASVEPATLPKIMTRFIQNHYSMFILCGGQFADTGIRFAAMYPDLYFVGFGSLPTTDNTAMILHRIDQWHFLNGIICGLATKTNKIAMFSVLIVPSSPYISTNAFWKGATLVNPNVQVEMYVSDSYFDKVVAITAVHQLKERGVDCLSIQQNDQTANQEADKNQIISGGFSGDSRFQSGEFVFSSGIAVWDTTFVSLIEQVYTDTWIPKHLVVAGFNQSAVRAAWWSTIARQPQYEYMRTTVQSYIDLFTNTSEELIFCGSLATDAGFPKSNDSDCMTSVELLQSNTIVPQVKRTGNLTREGVTRHVYVNWKSASAKVMLTLVGIFLALAFGIFVHLMKYYSNTNYKSSASLFMALILVGNILVAVSLIFWSAKPSPTTCMLRAWFAFIGEGLVLAAILAKTYRIHKIFQIDNLKIVALSDLQLVFNFIATIVCAELVILIFWQSLDPMVPATKIQSGLAYDEVHLYCKSKSIAGLAVALTFNGLLVISVLVVAWAARTVPDKWNEASLITYVSFVIILTGIIGIGSQILMSSNYIASYVASMVSVIIIMFSTVGFIFLPKIFYAHDIWSISSSITAPTSPSLKTKVGTPRSGSSRTRSRIV